jgi:hypothetical protein
MADHFERTLLWGIPLFPRWREGPNAENESARKQEGAGEPQVRHPIPIVRQRRDPVRAPEYESDGAWHARSCGDPRLVRS